MSFLGSITFRMKLYGRERLLQEVVKQEQENFLLTTTLFFSTPKGAIMSITHNLLTILKNIKLDSSTKMTGGFIGRQEDSFEDLFQGD